MIKCLLIIYQKWFLIYLKTSFGSIPGRKTIRNNVLNLNNIIKNKQSDLIKRN